MASFAQRRHFRAAIWIRGNAITSGILAGRAFYAWCPEYLADATCDLRRAKTQLRARPGFWAGGVLVALWAIAEFRQQPFTQ